MNLPTNTLKQQGHIYTQTISVLVYINYFGEVKNKEVYETVSCASS